MRTRTGNTAGEAPSSSLSKCKLKIWLSRPLLSCFRSCITDATSSPLTSLVRCVRLKCCSKLKGLQGQRGRTSVFRCLVSMDTSTDASPGSEKRMPGVRPPLRMRTAALLPSSRRKRAWMTSTPAGNLLHTFVACPTDTTERVCLQSNAETHHSHRHLLLGRC